MSWSAEFSIHSNVAGSPLTGILHTKHEKTPAKLSTTARDSLAGSQAREATLRERERERESNEVD